MIAQTAIEFPQSGRVLVTGATGYVGGRLVPRLLGKGYSVRVLVRDPQRLEGRSWLKQVEVCQGDVTQPETLTHALQGVHAAFYLIHSMGSSADFKEKDLEAGRNFGTAAHLAGVQRIIYLGGLGDPTADLSQHLRSRQQTGERLREAGVPVTEFRAAVIVGSGSLSFEMIRYLTERIPVMICPRWVFTRTQPISIHNVLDYLVDALQTPESAGKIIEIGGADILTYGQMMLGYAKERGLRRWLLPVPVLTPRLSSYWVHWMTPIPASIAKPLIEGLRNEVVVRTDSAKKLFPNIQPMSYQSAVHSALENLERGEVETLWSDALTSSQGNLPAVYFTQEQGMFIERREKETLAAPETVFRIFSGLGGQRGWLMLDAAWRLRGALDRLVGGVGMRRGRRHPDELRVGDVVDFWRVEILQPGRLLRLRAEMKVPGKAWLQFEANPRPAVGTVLVQTAYFASKGLLGLAYWYVLYPIHATIFGGMVQKIAERAESAPFPPGQPDFQKT
jgi:uncharacterized protein YbjT (DUF2867 family)